MQDLGKNYGLELGCGAGALAGAIIGNQISNDTMGTLVGAGIGTAVGCYAGSVWQSRMQDLERLAQQENIPLEIAPLENTEVRSQPRDAGLVAQVQDSSMFATGASRLTPTGKTKIQKLAAAFAKELPNSKTQDRHLLVVGHTDATGSASLNQQLSERRAREVGKLLQAAGIPANRIYYQGAGSSRPIAANATPAGRDKNRRVEITEVASEELMVQRIKAESANAKYLEFGTTAKAPAKVTASAKAPIQGPANTPSPAKRPTASSQAQVDFGGKPSDQASLNIAGTIKPKSGGFAVISRAHADEIPVQNCLLDAPRQSGQVLSLANDKPMASHKTYEFMRGYNNRVWANTVNGHLVTISPISILKDNAEVGKQPFLQIVDNYTEGNRKAKPKLSAIANTFEGENKVLYRVFTSKASAPISCIDIVFEKEDAKAFDGQLFYPDGSSHRVSKFVPIKT